MTQATDQQKRSVIDQFYEAFSRKDVELLRHVVSSDWEYIPEPVGVKPGPEQMVPMFAEIATSFPDMRIEILDVLIAGDRVGVRARVTATQSGELLGIEATSKPVDFAIHSFHELRGDRIIKTWHLEDWLTVFKQIGRVPPGLASQ